MCSYLYSSVEARVSLPYKYQPGLLLHVAGRCTKSCPIFLFCHGFLLCSPKGVEVEGYVGSWHQKRQRLYFILFRFIFYFVLSHQSASCRISFPPVSDL